VFGLLTQKEYICRNQIHMNNLGYVPKRIYFDSDGTEKLVNGIRTISKAVKSTLGPSGNTVLIESPEHTKGITVTKDGVTVARSIELLDPVENLAVRMVKEAADRTATSAGDGTTTAIVLTEALILGGLSLIGNGTSRTEVLRELILLSDGVVASLKKESKKLSNAMLYDVATISANNDKAIGRIIADIYKDIGREGIVTVEKSQTSNTYTETTKGLKVDRGFTSPLFITDQGKDECVLEDTMVLVSDIEISTVLQIEQILKPIITEGKRLLIISPCSTNFITTLAANVLKGTLRACVIAPPNFGYKQSELMQDIAISVGATYFSEKTGDDLSLMNYGSLGHVQKAVVGRDKTILLRSSARVNQEAVAERVGQLTSAMNNANKKADKDFLLERIASLTGGIGVIRVGGNTDLEQKELYDRIDDAVCAVRSALEEGILPGAGKALVDVDLKGIVGGNPSKDRECAGMILSQALSAPIRQILKNADMDYDQVYKKDTPHGHGYNLKTNKMGDLVHMGVIDPTKVTRSALENAVSVATTILSTNAIVTMARTYEA
jgi:chaperonin GroEL